MIQLATEPTASRMSFRPLARSEAGGKEPALEPRPGRGHAWPFLSPHVARPSRDDRARHHAGTDSGS